MMNIRINKAAKDIFLGEVVSTCHPCDVDMVTCYQESVNS